MKKNIRLIPTLAIAALLPVCSQAQIIISEVDPNGSSASYGQDWFELKNTGTLSIDITGWKMDDSSSNFLSASVSLRGVTSIAAGQSVVFIEDGTDPSADSTLDATFASDWFGGGVPAGLVVGNYGGSGVGLSSGGDAVNIFNSSGAVQAYVSFGSTSLGDTLDNTAGINGAISQLSQTGVNGAFASFDGEETGSPGNVAPAPEPATCALLGLGAGGLLAFRNRRK